MKNLKEVETKISLDSIIEYIENTEEESWNLHFVRSEDGKKNCFFGHLFNYAGGDERIKGIELNCGSYVWMLFEELFATTYMIFEVNDGDDPEYQQETPKQRVLQYLKDLRDGKAKTTQQLMKEYEEECRKEYEEQKQIRASTRQEVS